MFAVRIQGLERTIFRLLWRSLPWIWWSEEKELAKATRLAAWRQHSTRSALWAMPFSGQSVTALRCPSSETTPECAFWRVKVAKELRSWHRVNRASTCMTNRPSLASKIKSLVSRSRIPGVNSALEPVITRLLQANVLVLMRLHPDSITTKYSMDRVWSWRFRDRACTRTRGLRMRNAPRRWTSRGTSILSTLEWSSTRARSVSDLRVTRAFTTRKAHKRLSGLAAT